MFATMTQGRSPESALAFFRDGAVHNTAKSGALLGAQGIFVVVDIFALDHGWPIGPVFAAMLLMLAGSLIVMTNLRGSTRPFERAAADGAVDPVRGSFNLVMTRMLRFNIALYLTFLSIVLLAVAALIFAF